MTGMHGQVSPREVGQLTAAVEGLTEAVGLLREELRDDYVRKDVLDPTLAAMQITIDGHTSWLVWAQRIVLGAVLTAMLAYVIYTGGTPPTH